VRPFYYFEDARAFWGALFNGKGEIKLETRVAIVSIIVENHDSAFHINNILHEYAENIIGRMGLPHRGRNIGIISVVLDATNDTISALSGRLGRLDGVSAKTLYSK
jgi:putative iron-only hydrogenase system regulator